MKTVTLNFESKNSLTNEETRVYFLRLYNSSIDKIYKRNAVGCDNEISYIVNYDTVQSMDEIIRDIKYLCYTMGQNCIACQIVDDDLTASMMISNSSLDIRYKYFDSLYFITIEQAHYNENCKLIYSRVTK